MESKDEGGRVRGGTEHVRWCVRQRRLGVWSGSGASAVARGGEGCEFVSSGAMKRRERARSWQSLTETGTGGHLQRQARTEAGELSAMPSGRGDGASGNAARERERAC